MTVEYVTKMTIPADSGLKKYEITGKTCIFAFQSSVMGKILANTISILFHPLFIMGYVLLFLMMSQSYMFGFSDIKAQNMVIFSIIATGIMFPLLSILLMKSLGLISSWEMADKKERIAPLIVTGLFYLWLYVNIRKNGSVPDAFSFFVLGSTVAVFMALFLNSFTKISLHTIGMGGFITGILFIIFKFSYGYTDIPVPVLDGFLRLSDRAVIFIVLLLGGAVGVARLALKAHQNDEIYGGYFIGFLSQLIAFRLFFA